jgi:antitoxin (DNA-binding transcriptional repressor) of toxin-antitoxin stability system
MPRKKIRIIDIKEAQEKLEELIDALKPGEWFIISVNGELRFKVVALTDQEREQLMHRKRKGKR